MTIVALRRKFGNKYYGFDSYYRQIGRAMSQAKRLRKAGNLARVTYNKKDGVWKFGQGASDRRR